MPLNFLQIANAGSAEPLRDVLAALHDLDLLDIEVPASPGRFLRPRAIVPELWPPAATLTFRHLNVLRIFEIPADTGGVHECFT